MNLGRGAGGRAPGRHAPEPDAEGGAPRRRELRHLLLDVDLLEAGSLHLAEEAETKRRAFLLKPDILVRKGRSPHVVADTKWKRLDPRSADLGVSGEDVYQVLAYAHRYATDTAVLIYPHHAALGRPGLQRDFVIQVGGGSRVVVRVVTLDLARLERVAGEVGEAVGAG